MEHTRTTKTYAPVPDLYTSDKLEPARAVVLAEGVTFLADGFAVVPSDSRDAVLVVAYAWKLAGRTKWRQVEILATFPTPDALSAGHDRAIAYAKALAAGAL